MVRKKRSSRASLPRQTVYNSTLATKVTFDHFNNILGCCCRFFISNFKFQIWSVKALSKPERRKQRSGFPLPVLNRGHLDTE